MTGNEGADLSSDQGELPLARLLAFLRERRHEERFRNSFLGGFRARVGEGEEFASLVPYFGFAVSPATMITVHGLDEVGNVALDGAGNPVNPVMVVADPAGNAELLWEFPLPYLFRFEFVSEDATGKRSSRELFARGAEFSRVKLPDTVRDGQLLVDFFKGSDVHPDLAS